LIGDGYHPLKRDDVKVVNAGRSLGGVPDVGFIEIEQGATAKLGRVPIGVDRLCDAGPGQAGRMAFLYGFPTKLIKHAINHKRREKLFAMQSFTYTNVTFALEEWPEVPKADLPPLRSRDLFIPYDVKEEMAARGGNDSHLPNPEGASGGGIWQGTGDKRELWHPDKVKLIAIQSTWHEERKYVRGVQIKHWVRLIERHYPDLKRHIGRLATPRSLKSS
jgi:hypothetical protein